MGMILKCGLHVGLRIMAGFFEDGVSPSSTNVLLQNNLSKLPGIWNQPVGLRMHRMKECTSNPSTEQVRHFPHGTSHHSQAEVPSDLFCVNTYKLEKGARTWLHFFPHLEKTASLSVAGNPLTGKANSNPVLDTLENADFMDQLEKDHGPRTTAMANNVENPSGLQSPKGRSMRPCLTQANLAAILSNWTCVMRGF